MSADWPYRWTGISARTRPPVMRLTIVPSRRSQSRSRNFRTSVGERLKVTGSMSQNTGRAPKRAMVPAVAKNVNGEVITSSPARTSRAISASSSASVPEETPMPCAALQ